MDLTDFTFNFSGSQGAFVAVRNGHRQRSGNTESLVLQNDVTVERTRQGRQPATIVHTLQAAFTPADGSTLEQGAPLPDGTISVSGTLTWSRNTRSFVFTATTTVPLEYDSACSGPRRDRIAAGEIRWALPSGRTIVTTWTGCGFPPTRQVVNAQS